MLRFFYHFWFLWFCGCFRFGFDFHRFLGRVERGVAVLNLLLFVALKQIFLNMLFVYKKFYAQLRPLTHLAQGQEVEFHKIEIGDRMIF